MPHRQYVDIDPVDLSEAPRLAKEVYPRAAVIGAVLLALMFLALLVYGSLPELSPKDIVAMDGYAGERPTKHIFNLQSIDAEQVSSEVAVTQQAATESVAEPSGNDAGVPTETTMPELSQTQVAAENEAADTTAPVAATTAASPQVAPTQATAVIESPDVKTVETVKIAVERQSTPAESESIVANLDAPTPVPTLSAVAAEKVVASMATTDTVDEVATTVVISSVAADEPSPMPIRRNEYRYAELARGPAIASVTPGSNEEQQRLLPLRTVLNDYTEVKKTPSALAETLMSLGEGVLVTVFEKKGDWIYIGTNDGSATTGYVLESAISSVDR